MNQSVPYEHTELEPVMQSERVALINNEVSTILFSHCRTGPNLSFSYSMSDRVKWHLQVSLSCAHIDYDAMLPFCLSIASLWIKKFLK